MNEIKKIIQFQNNKTYIDISCELNKLLQKEPSKTFKWDLLIDLINIFDNLNEFTLRMKEYDNVTDLINKLTVTGHIDYRECVHLSNNELDLFKIRVRTLNLKYDIKDLKIKCEEIMNKRQRKKYLIAYSWYNNVHFKYRHRYCIINYNKFDKKVFQDIIKNDINKQNKGYCKKIIIHLCNKLTNNEYSKWRNIPEFKNDRLNYNGFGNE